MGKKRVLLLRAAVLVALLGMGLAPAAKAVRQWRLRRWRAALDAAFAQVRRGDDTVTFPQRPDGDQRAGEDDASARRLADLAWRGPRGALFQRDLLRIAREEAARWPELLPGAAQARLLRELPRAAAGTPVVAAAVSGVSWANIGPTSANFEWNGAPEPGANDSGRPNTIRVDPRDANVVYLATSGGGIWKTYDFTATTPTWIPITETLGNLAIGAMDEDPNAARADTLWVGLGDFVDTKGGVLVRTTDGGASWSTPIALAGTYASLSATAPNGGAVVAANVRDLRIDPNNPDIVLAATDVGLFSSTNATSVTPTFTLVDLPNAGGNVEESVWTFAYTGTGASGSHWVASGVYACDNASFPPSAGAGLPVGSFNPPCTGGNLGDLWTSSDAGATWVSARAGLSNPFPPGGSAANEVGRMAVASRGATVYVEMSSVDEGGGGGANRTTGFLKSTDGGATWPTSVASTTLPSNPTNAGNTDCTDLNLGHDQSWYNFTVAVDPSDANHAVFGGNLCGARTTDGGASFDLVANWLPGNGTTAGGTLPYVHADWHAALIAGGVSYIGSDGGLFASSNLFSASPPFIAWRQPDVGIVSHLMYSIGSGDPVDGDSFIVFTGLQDNGTRFRDTNAGGPSTDPTIFNQVIGGDGIGVAANNNGGSGTTNEIYWAVNPGGPRSFCKPATAFANCNSGQDNAVPANPVWTGTTMTPPGGDGEPFLIHFSPVVGDANSSVLTHTNRNVWLATFSSTGGQTPWTRISSGFPANNIRNIHASPRVFVVGGVNKRLYGVALSGGAFAVGVDGSPICNTAGCVTFMVAGNPVGLGTGPIGLSQRFTTSIAFPCAFSSPNCTNNGQTYLAATAAPVLSDGATPVTPSMGHLFKTTDNGTSWTAFHGNGTGADLPNVPIEVVRFDPGDTSDQVIYVGTDLGMYRTTDGGNTWERYGAGLPMVRVNDVFIAKNGGLLRIATYGRGLWEIFPGTNNPHGVPGDGDFDRNLSIDFLDLGALASRLGTTPATSTTPLYDWNMDLTGTVNAIDESDLSALLAKFGSRP